MMVFSLKELFYNDKEMMSCFATKLNYVIQTIPSYHRCMSPIELLSNDKRSKTV